MLLNHHALSVIPFDITQLMLLNYHTLSVIPFALRRNETSPLTNSSSSASMKKEKKNQKILFSHDAGCIITKRKTKESCWSLCMPRPGCRMIFFSFLLQNTNAFLLLFPTADGLFFSFAWPAFDTHTHLKKSYKINIIIQLGPLFLPLWKSLIIKRKSIITSK
jgi:hypothetical protein